MMPRPHSVVAAAMSATAMRPRSLFQRSRRAPMCGIVARDERDLNTTGPPRKVARPDTHHPKATGRAARRIPRESYLRLLFLAGAVPDTWLMYWCHCLGRSAMSLRPVATRIPRMTPFTRSWVGGFFSVIAIRSSTITACIALGLAGAGAGFSLSAGESGRSDWGPLTTGPFLPLPFGLACALAARAASLSAFFFALAASLSALALSFLAWASLRAISFFSLALWRAPALSPAARASAT